MSWLAAVWGMLLAPALVLALGACADERRSTTHPDAQLSEQGAKERIQAAIADLCPDIRRSNERRLRTQIDRAPFSYDAEGGRWFYETGRSGGMLFELVERLGEVRIRHAVCPTPPAGHGGSPGSTGSE